VQEHDDQVPAEQGGGAAASDGTVGVQEGEERPTDEGGPGPVAEGREDGA